MSRALPSIPVRPPTKTEQVHGWLREAILTHALAPGTYLNIDELARRHGVSAIPVREAVARLATERLAVIRPHFGAEVAPLDDHSVHDVFALLEGLETASAARVAALANAEDLAELETLLGQLDRAAGGEDPAVWGRVNTAFHLRLAGIARLPLVQDELRIAFDHWERIRRHFFRTAAGPRVDEAQQEHRAMVEAVRRGTAGTLERILRRHNRTARDTYLRALTTPARPA
ncbi:MAG: GntR family transcriptional regulator [Verrucomicrobia bacterium]|nr:GntR family transcriptional regulator [Verrucomicrobiota bacterium]